MKRWHFWMGAGVCFALAAVLALLALVGGAWAIDGAVNAALLAAEILAVSDDAIAEKLAAKREAGKQKVLAKNRAIEAQYPPL